MVFPVENSFFVTFFLFLDAMRCDDNCNPWALVAGLVDASVILPKYEVYKRLIPDLLNLFLNDKYIHHYQVDLNCVAFLLLLYLF